MTSSSTSSSFVGGWMIWANPAKATIPICVPSPWRCDERRGGLLGGHEAVRRDVGRAHAPRHVHREHDGRPAVRHRNDRRRPCHRDDQAAEPDQEQRERQVATDPRRARDRHADERQAREAEAGPTPSQRPDPDDDERREGDEEHEQGRPQERHGAPVDIVMACVRTSAATPGRRRRSSANPAAANNGVSSNGSVRTTSLLPTSS